MGKYKLKRKVWDREENGNLTVPCYWCWTHLSYTQGTVDHLFPKGIGGSNKEENLAWSCLRCNQKRARELTIFLNHEIQPKCEDCVFGPLDIKSPCRCLFINKEDFTNAIISSEEYILRY